MKINNIEIKEKYFAYDNCHKIYLLKDKKEQKEAKKLGCQIQPIEKLQKIYNNSCPLRFISKWDLSKTYAKQGQNAFFEE